MTAWTGRRVVLGVSGGIACYKSCTVARRLAELGAWVDVVLTRAAAEFVRPVTFEALTGRPVLTSLWDRDGALAHLRFAQDPNLIVVAPATAHLIARAAQGLADDLLTTVLVARGAPVLMAPAMNDEMYANPITQANLKVLRAQGIELVGPEVGALAEGPSDRPGRMSEPETILAVAARLVRGRGALFGRRVLVTAGPTRESIDPVRVVTNRSSGKMGYRLAEVAWERGAEVTLIAGPGELPDPIGINVERVETTGDLEDAVRRGLPSADVFIMAAAPADYRPIAPAAAKGSRSENAVAIPMEPTIDILSVTRGLRRPGSIAVGFALETGDAVAKGREKLARKALDLIVVNDAFEPGAAFEVDTNRVSIVDREGALRELPLLSKRDVAEAILDAVEARLV